MSSKRGYNILLNAVEYTMKCGGFDTILKPLRFTSGGEGRCIGEFIVTKEHLNPYQGLHGGYTASVIDNVTTYALMTTNSHPGITTNLHIRYMKSAKEGDVLIVDANTVKAGNKFAFLECELRHKSDGSLVAKGGQTKFIDLPKGKLSVLYD